MTKEEHLNSIIKYFVLQVFDIFGCQILKGRIFKKI